MSDVQFKTKLYQVVIKEDRSGYSVVNLETGVVEYDNPALPRCIIIAEEYTAALQRLDPVAVSPTEVLKDASILSFPRKNDTE